MKGIKASNQVQGFSENHQVKGIAKCRASDQVRVCHSKAVRSKRVGWDSKARALPERSPSSESQLGVTARPVQHRNEFGRGQCGTLDVTSVATRVAHWA